MSARRAVAGSLLALCMPASLLLATTASDASETGSTASFAPDARKAKGKIKLTVMPQIVQQGKKPSSSSSAKAAFEAKIKGAKAGTPAVLQVQKGKAWKTAAKTKVGAKGIAQFASKVSKGGKALTYRVSVKGKTSKPVSTEKWLTSSFTDEFSGSALSANWNYRGFLYEPDSLRECSKGDPSAVKVSGGVVQLSVIKDPARASEQCVAKKDGKSTGKFAYRLNGHIGTEGNVSITRGFAAARIKTHKLRGQHGGFWMRPPASAGGDPRAEIDVIEYFGDKHPSGGLTSFTYSTKGNKAVKTGSWIKKSDTFLKNKKDGWSKNYHVFSVEWTAKEYIFRIDGKETWRTKVGVSDLPHFPILSLLSSDYEISQMPGGDKKLPQTMQVDWVRLWQA